MHKTMIHIRISPHIKEILEKMSAKQGVSVSELVRNIILREIGR